MLLSANKTDLFSKLVKLQIYFCIARSFGNNIFSFDSQIYILEIIECIK